MYYHVLIETQEMNIHDIDRTSLEELEMNVVEPFLKNQEFNFRGYFVEPSKVIRLLITESDTRNGPAYDPIMASFESQYSIDITRETFRKVKERLGDSPIPLVTQPIESQQMDTSQPSMERNQYVAAPRQKTIFLAYSYREEDEEFVEGFKDLLMHNDFQVLDGKADRLGPISQAILEKINLSDIVIIVMNKRDLKANGKFTTSAWLLEEKGAALAFGKQVAMMIEEEVDGADIGGLQGDDQLFHFTRNNFLKKAMNLIKIIDNVR